MYAVARKRKKKRKKRRKKERQRERARRFRERERMSRFSLFTSLVKSGKTCCCNKRATCEREQDSRKARGAKKKKRKCQLGRVVSLLFSFLCFIADLARNKIAWKRSRRDALECRISHSDSETGDFYFRQLERNGIVSSETYSRQ